MVTRSAQKSRCLLGLMLFFLWMVLTRIKYDPENVYESLHEVDTALDTFEYTVSDGKGGTEVATVTIIIDGNNDLPTAADDSESTTEDTSVSNYVLMNDSDPEGDSLSFL